MALEKRLSREDALARSGLVSDVGDSASLDALPEDLSQGEWLCKDGDLADRMWIVREGTVVVEKAGKVIAERRAGEIVGEQAMLAPAGRRGADMRAGAPRTAVLTIRRGALETHREAAALYRNLARVVSGKLTQATVERAETYASYDRLLQERRRFIGNFQTGHPEVFGSPQRRPFLIMFSDVVGFSDLASTLSPENVGELVDAFFGPQVTEIEASGGVVDKFIGDGLMAFWPLTLSEAPKVVPKAFSAVLRARNGVRNLAQAEGRLDLRIGLHLGEALAGNFGTATRAQFTILGHEVNVAARLEQLKTLSAGETPGALRVSPPVFELLSAEQRTLLPLSDETKVKNTIVRVHASRAEEK